MKKKILFVAYSLTGGGAEKALVNLLNMLDYSRYDVTLQLVENRGINLEYLPAPVKLRPALKDTTWLLDSGKPFIKQALCHARLGVIGKRLCVGIKMRGKTVSPHQKNLMKWRDVKNLFPKEKEHFDIAAAYLQGFPIYYAVDCVNADKKLGWMHIDYSKIDAGNRESFEAYFKKLDGFVTVSQKCVNSLQEAFPKLSNIKLLYNLNSPELIHSLSVRDAIEDMDTSVPTVLSIGRMTEQKGYDFALQAAAIMKRAGFRFTWYVMGAGPLEQELRAMAHELDVEDVFVFLGVRSNPYPYIKAATVIAQTSRYEGKSVVLDEAKILKKPILATNYNSVSDQITNGRDGYVVDMNPEAIAKGLMALLSDEEKQKALAEALASFSEEQAYWLKRHYELFEGKQEI